MIYPVEVQAAGDNISGHRIRTHKSGSASARLKQTTHPPILYIFTSPDTIFAATYSDQLYQVWLDGDSVSLVFKKSLEPD